MLELAQVRVEILVPVRVRRGVTMIARTWRGWVRTSTSPSFTPRMTATSSTARLPSRTTTSHGRRDIRPGAPGLRPGNSPVADTACGKAAWMPVGAVCSRWPAATRERRPAAGCFRSRPVRPVAQHPAPVAAAAPPPVQASTDIRAAGTCCSRPGSVLGLDYLFCGTHSPAVNVRSQDFLSRSNLRTCLTFLRDIRLGTGAVREVPGGSARCAVELGIRALSAGRRPSSPVGSR